MKEFAKKNWIFAILLLGIVFVFLKRYNYLPVSVVSNPDAQVTFTTQDGMLEQTWQPTVKMISGVALSYYAENDFSADVKLTVYSDDYAEVLMEAVQENYSFAAGTSGNIVFSFDRTKVIQGERYRFEFALLNETEEGILQITSGSNYGGCRIAGEETGQAAALTITFVKYSKLFWLVAVMLPLLGYSLLAMVITGKKWEETVGLSLLLEGIVLYGFGFFEHLVWGICVVYALALLSILTAIYLYNKKDLTIKSLLSPGLWVYLLLFLIIILTSNGDWLGNRDELRHWGIAVRDMFYYDSFAKHVNTTVIMPRYLPFTAIIEYVFVYMNGMFSEDILLIAYQTMLLSMLIIVCKPLEKKGGKKLAIPSIVALICVPVIFFNNISSCIMVDSLLAFIMTYALICYYTEKLSWLNITRITCALVSLTLIKDIGLIFAGMIAFIIFGDMVITQIKQKKLNIKQLLYPIICVILVLGIYISWQAYLSIPVKRTTTMTVDTTQQGENTEETSLKTSDVSEVTVEATVEVADAMSASNVSLEGLINIFKGDGEPFQYQVTRNFITELFDGETYSFGTLKFSFVDLLAISAFLVVSLGYFGYWQEGKIRMYAFAGMIFLASILLCAFLQVTYWFSFGIYDGLALTSIDRYLAPYICAVIIAVLYFICDTFCIERDSVKVKYLMATLSVLLMISMPVAGLVLESKDIEGNTTEEITYGHSQIEEILRSVAKRGERAYFVCSNSDGYSEYVFRNTVCPIVSEHMNWNIVATEELHQEQYALYGKENIDDNEAVIFSKEAWEGQLWESQYVVVFHADELFKKSYSEFFEEPERIGDGCVYRIAKGDGTISLQLIGQTDIKGWH